MPNRDDFQSVRKEYLKGVLSEDNLPSSPLDLFNTWYSEAKDLGIVEPNAFALTTCRDNKPSVRYVLLKELSNEGFVFFTNYESRKGKELLDNPNCAGTFYWKDLERQVRFEGIAKKVSEAVSDQYFASRPREAQIGVHVSKQSNVIADRDMLEKTFKDLELSFQDKEISRPEYWGGYVVEPQVVEFWQGRVGRLHDRIRFIKSNLSWERERLSP
jgi:pyridoxamine 5'-phosphate oxidase